MLRLTGQQGTDSFFNQEAGLESAWSKARWILSPVRLPVSRRSIKGSHVAKESA